jgi:histidinol phosphatase-like enzyme
VIHQKSFLYYIGDKVTDLHLERLAGKRVGPKLERWGGV